MKIYFAGSGRQKDRLDLWFDIAGIKRKLFSYYDVIMGGGKNEFDYIIKKIRERRKA